MKPKELKIYVLLLVFVAKPEKCYGINQECSLNDGTYAGTRNTTNTRRSCFPWKSTNRCFKGIADASQSSTHNYCRNPFDPPDCHRALPWCYTDEHNEAWEYCDLPKCNWKSHEGCLSPLGMGDGRIKDDQIFAPSAAGNDQAAKYARINESNTNVWRASWYNPQFSYLSVNLINPHHIYKIHIQGSNGYNVKKYKILYSDDGHQWQYYNENKDDPNNAQEFDGNHGGYDTSIAYLSLTITAIKIAIIPTSFENLPTLRIELYGCPSNTTVISGTEVTSISNNAYWSPDNSPYIISSPLTIGADTQLTIEASVRVIFVGKTASLTVSGCLEMKGIKGLEVKFLTDNVLSYTGAPMDMFNNNEPFWGGVFLNSDARGCKLDSIEHVVLVGAGITTGIKSFEFHNVEISNSLTGIKFTDVGDNITVKDCRFLRNSKGIETPLSTVFIVQSSEFVGNDKGVFIKYMSGSTIIQSNITFVDSVFENNGVGINYNVYCSQVKLSFIILRCNFTNHKERAFESNPYCEIHPQFVIESSIFVSSPITIYSSSSEYYLRIEGSHIKGSHASSAVTVDSGVRELNLTGTTFSGIIGQALVVKSNWIESVVRINQSIFSNNSGEGCLSINGQNARVYMMNSKLINNTVNSVVYVDVFNSPEIIITRNIFTNFLSKYEISNFGKWRPNYSVVADFNYWGSTDTENITNRIFDFFKDTSRSFVKISKISVDQNFTQTKDISDSQLWYHKNETIGGRLSKSIKLSSSFNLTVTKNIHIPRGLCLEIRGPLTLQFPPGFGILVEEGCLKINSNVILTSLTDGIRPWDGIKIINSNKSVLSEVSILNADIAFELINSTLIVNESIIKTNEFAQIKGQSYNELEIWNSDIECSHDCLRVSQAEDVKVKLTKVSMVSLSANMALENSGELQFELIESTVECKYNNYLLNFGYQIKNGYARVQRSSFVGQLMMQPGGISFRFEGNNFTSEQMCLQFSDYANFPKNVTLLENTFKCGSLAISYAAKDYSSDSSLVIDRNQFLKGEVAISNTHPQKLDITNNYFSSLLRKDYVFVGIALFAPYGQTNPRNGRVHVANNIFEDVIGNGQSSTLRLTCISEQYRRYLSVIYFENNTFTDNNVTDTILTDCPGLNSARNILINPNSNNEVRVIGNSIGGWKEPIYFSRNFWGDATSDPNIKVYDESNDRSLMRIQTEPWYKDRNMTILAKSKNTFFKPNNEIGGTLTQDITLLSKDHSYVVVEDISVPAGLKLTVESGVKLAFASGGINVEGTLVAHGNETHEIVFNSTTKSSKWKGLYFQKQNPSLLQMEEFGWWQIKHKGIWKPVFLFDNVYKKPTADLLCKQAGFKESLTQTTFQCDSLSPSDKIKVRPCNDSSIPSARIQCDKGGEFSLLDCTIYESTAYAFHNITCLRQTSKSEIFIKIQSNSGKWLSFDEETNKLTFVSSNSENEVFFLQSTQCNNNADSNCFSLMPLKRLGWYLRINQSQAIVDPMSNPIRPDDFSIETSFTTVPDKVATEYSNIKLTSRSTYLVDTNDYLNVSLFDPPETANENIYAFKILPSDMFSSRKKRDTESVQQLSDVSSLRKVKIINADQGLFVRGVPPALEEIQIISSASHGIHYKGFFDDSASMTLKSSWIMESGGSGVFYELTADSIDSESLIDGCEIHTTELHSVNWIGAGSLRISNSSLKQFRKAAVDALSNTWNIFSTVAVTSNTISSTTSETTMSLRNTGCSECLVVNITDNNFLDSLEYKNYDYQFFNLDSVSKATLVGNSFKNITYHKLVRDQYSKHLKFENNLVKGNKLSSILELHRTIQFSIKSNSFLQNTHKVYYNKLSTLRLDNSDDGRFEASITNNTFSNLESAYEVFIDTQSNTLRDVVLDLSMNKWNLANYSLILSKIYCFFNDAYKLPVNIWPAVYTINGSDSLLARPTTDNNYFFNGSGGEIAFSFTIPAEKYVLQNSIYVPENVTLTIEPGTTIEFASGRGMVVKGNLVANATQSNITNIRKARKIEFIQSNKGKLLLNNVVFEQLQEDVVRFNTSKLSLTNVVFKDIRTNVLLFSNNIELIDCTFNNIQSGLVTNKFDPNNVPEFSKMIIKNSSFNKCYTAISARLNFNDTQLINCTFTENTNAIRLQDQDTPNASLKITGCTFKDNQYAVIGSTNEYIDIDISRCYFRDNPNNKGQNLEATGVNIDLNRINSLLLRENVFEANVQTAVKIRRVWTSFIVKQVISLQENHFSNITNTAVSIQDMFGVDLILTKNKFTSNIADRSIKNKPSAIEIAFHASHFVNYDWPSANISVVQNTFQNNGGSNVVKLWSSFDPEDSLKKKFYKFDVSSNTFLNNFPFNSTVASGIFFANFSYNVFSNQLTKYDFEVQFKEEFSQNCTLNWWGSASATEVRKRIRDNHESANLGRVIYEPFLNKSEFSCDGVKSCSGRGTCIAPDVCQCLSGWSGPSCDKHSCSRVHDCLGRGDCVGPDLCSCRAGWTGADCSRASCLNRNNCSERGVCIRPDECLCSEQFSGPSCSDCSAGRWGRNCDLCPSCQHGLCNKTTGKCDCVSNNWVGELCDRCAPKFFGPLCLPLVRLFNIFPTSGPDVGGTEIYFFGNNLPNVTTYTCRFDGSMERNASWVSESSVLCISPTHAAATVKVELSINPEQGYLDSKFDFTYSAVCPASACGSSVVPQRGTCSMGECNCLLPWTGKDCDQLGIAPKIEVVNKTVILIEGQDMAIQFNVTEATRPVQWSVVSAPGDSLLDGSTGKLTWSKVPASIKPYKVVVRCSNKFGQDDETFDISVPPSYSATLDDLPKGPFLSPKSVLISGKINWLVDNTHIKKSQIPVVLKIKSNYGMRNIPLVTPPLDTKGIFYTRFQPFPSEVGLTQLDVRHPADVDKFQEQQNWKVYGFSMSLNPTSISEYVGEYKYPNFITLSNTGLDPLTRLQIMQINTPFDVKLSSNDSSVINCSVNLSNCTMNNLLPGQIITISAIMQAYSPTSGVIEVVVRTIEDVVVESQLQATFQQKTPIFKLSKSLVDATVTRGNIYMDKVSVTNVGLKAATNVKPIFPNSTTLSMVTFGTNSSSLTSLTQPGLTLESGDTAELTLSFNPSKLEDLGDMKGFLSIYSLETRSPIEFRFVIVSTNRVDFSVRVEDEYTYFSKDRPLLADAKISLTSKYGGETLTVTSNATGIGTFSNITEGYYILYTSADKHLPDSRVLFVSFGENSRVSVFLQRTAVTYSWVVRPVPFEDRYDITLEADFTTNVPIPVVTMEPTQIDLETLENGLVSALQFKITNHGLIAAKGFQFNLPSPDSHPYVILSMDEVFVGDIPANTTLYAVVNVNINETARQRFLDPKQVTKRSIVQCFNMLLKAVYYYVCDKKRYNELMAAIDNSKVCHADVKPGNRIHGVFRPWLAPALGWGAGSDLSKGTTVVTPVNCNCAFNYPYTCWKAFRVVVTCVKIFYSPNKLKTGYYVVQCIRKLEKIVECVQLFIECQFQSKGSSRRRRRSADLSREEMGPILARRSMAVFEYYKLGSEYIGDDEWFYLAEPPKEWWSEVFEPVFADTSEGGTLVTRKEFDGVMKIPPPSNATVDMVKNLLVRYNESFYNWNRGDFTTRQNNINFEKVQQIENEIKKYEDEAKEANMNSIADWYIAADDAFNRAEEKPEKGICAKVRIQIQQRMTLTRTGFEATLQLENGETSALSNIDVKILITTFGQNSTEATDKFAIGKPTLSGMTDVTGTGKLEIGVKGTATWLIVPLSSAAPTSDIQYNVGGTLYYSIGSENLTVPLFPDTITVKPDPRLVVNYFLEKYVFSDDPFTPALEPAVPFNLGMLITNGGYGAATSLKITSSQPEIIDNEKGLLVNFQIVGTQIDAKEVSPSLTVDFGDMLPHTTRAAKWIMTCSLSGTFSNFSATFQNTNPLGDPRLSVLERVDFHELLHAVMIDYPVSDLVADFLVVDPDRTLDLLPYLVYDSANGTFPHNVSSCNASIVSENTSEMRISANCPSKGWVYMRVPYKAAQLQQISSVRKNNIENIDATHNVWLQSISKKTYLQIFDHSYRDGDHFYDIYFTKKNAYTPKFSSEIYNLSISESTKTGTKILQLSADDEDGDNITYTLGSQSPQDTLPFILDNRGGLTLIRNLDREQTDFYSFTVLATDDGSPRKTGTAFVLMNITDENDNAPQISGIPSEIVLEDITESGYVVGIVKVTDLDAGINGRVKVNLAGDSDLLEYNSSSGAILVKVPLKTVLGKHNFSVIAEDSGTPPLRSVFNFTLTVIRQNRFAPKFNQTRYDFYMNESSRSGMVIGRVFASDDDGVNELLTYKLGSVRSLPFDVHQTKGDVYTTMPVKSLRDDTSFSFDVMVVDDGAQPTGKLSSSAEVTVHVIDINDNPPTFSRSSYVVKIKENISGETVLLKLDVTDSDFGLNGLVEKFVLEVINPILPRPSSVFELRSSPGSVQLICISRLDREVYKEYDLKITAADSGSPSLSSSVNVTVLVEDENDCTPEFSKKSANVTILRNAVVNSVVYTLSASDCDETSKIYYNVETKPSYETSFVQLQKETGALRLIRSLRSQNFSLIALQMTASDGKFTSQPFELNIFVSDNNVHPPVFKQTSQTFYLNETSPIGFEVTVATASDEDGSVVFYEMLSGNEDGMFSINRITGKLTLAKQLDYETKRDYKLTIAAYDDEDHRVALNGTTEIIIKIINVNEYPPSFANISGSLNLKIKEGVLIKDVYQFVVTDKDNDVVSLALLPSNDSSYFALDAKSGWLSVAKPLNRTLSSKMMIAVVATDNGKPQLKTVLDIIIDVLSAENVTPTTATPYVTRPLTSPSSANPGKRRYPLHVILVVINVHLIFCLL